MSGFTLGCLLTAIASLSTAALTFVAGRRVSRFSIETTERRYAIALILAIIGILSAMVFVGRQTNWMHY